MVKSEKPPTHKKAPAKRKRTNSVSDNDNEVEVESVAGPSKGRSRPTPVVDVPSQKSTRTQATTKKARGLSDGPEDPYDIIQTQLGLIGSAFNVLGAAFAKLQEQ